MKVGWFAAVFVAAAALAAFLIGRGLNQVSPWAAVLGLPTAMLSAAAGVWSVVLAARTRREARSRISAEDTGVTISRRAAEIVDVQPGVSSIDFKFINRGDAVSVFHQFTIRTIDFRLDTTPLLECSYFPFGGVSTSGGLHYGTTLQLTVSNSGWGSALGFTAVLTCPILIDLFPPAALCFEFAEVESGANLYVTLLAEEADRAVMDRLCKRREVLLGKAVVALAEVDEEILGNEDFNTLLSFHEQWHIEEFFSDYQRTGDGPRQRKYIAELNSDYIPIRLNMHIEYTNQDRRPYSEDTVALGSFDRSMAEGVLWIGSAGFRYDVHQVAFAPSSGGDAYAVILDPDDPGDRNYRISRSIQPGAEDRFHVPLASRVSGDYCLQLSFHANGVQVVESDPLWISLSHPRNAHLPASLPDGASFELRNGRLELGSEVRGA